VVALSAQDLPIPVPAPTEIGDRAEAILSRSEFRQSESLLDRAGGWLNEAINDVFGNLSEGGAGSLVGWIILGGLLAAAVRFAMRMRPVARLASVHDPSVDIDTSGAVATHHKTAREWRAEATRLAGLGLFDEAVRARYRALLADLIQQDLVEDVPGRTPGEYRAEVAAAAPEAADSFGQLTELFEFIWYGPGEAVAQDLEQFGRGEQLVLAGVGR